MDKKSLNLGVYAALAGAIISGHAVQAQELSSEASHASAEAAVTPGTSSGLSLGLRAGGTSSTLNYSGNVPLTSKLGFMFGANLDAAFSEIFSIQPELDFVQQGAGIETGTTDLSASFNLTYLQLPVFLKAMIPTGAPVRPFIQAGPSLSVLVSRSATVTSGGVTQTVGGSDILARTLDYGLNFGAGMDIDVVRDVALVLDGRYYLGLGNVNNSGDGEVIRNRGAQFLTGLQYKM